MDFSFDRFYRLNRRAIIWLVLFGVIYYLREYFLLIFLTFIIGFFALPASRILMDRLNLGRKFSITAVYLSILVGYITIIWSVSPRFVEEVASLNEKIPEIKASLEVKREELSERFPEVAGLIESYAPADESEAAPDVTNEEILAVLEEIRDRLPEEDSAEGIENEGAREIAPIPRRVNSQPPPPSFIDRMSNRGAAQIQAGLLAVSGRLVGILAESLLAILFSYLIVLDFAGLSLQLNSLKISRLRDFYEEAGEPVVRFALAVGRGFQSIVVIAFITMLMMAIVLIALRIPQVFLLSVVVFASSLMPVVGVVAEAFFLLSVTFNEYSMDYHFWAVVICIAIVHIIIAYLITPLIFGRQFRLNMVVILIILYVGAQVAGIWGLILGVPVANYFIRDVFAIPLGGEAEGDAKPTRSVRVRSEDKPAIGIKQRPAPKS